MKIHLTAICEIAAAACARVGLENQKEPPSALAIGRHLGGDERAVRKEWEPLIGAIAGVLMGCCADFPKPAKPKKEKPEVDLPVDPPPNPDPESFKDNTDTSNPGDIAEPTPEKPKAEKPKKAKKKKKNG